MGNREELLMFLAEIIARRWLVKNKQHGSVPANAQRKYAATGQEDLLLTNRPGPVVDGDLERSGLPSEPGCSQR